ncbi:MAG: PAS domain-containing sensor histidine kinase [Deltaproteobacteria bacterium]|nr:PAS domain-containing sensor histidine kinase [Deltaproteobacteria bacterium]
MSTGVKEGSLSLSADGVIQRFGYGLEFILGYSSEEVIGRNFSVFSPAGREAEHARLLEDAKAGAITGYKTRLIRNDSEIIDIFMSVYPLRDPGGAVYSYILTITADKNVEIPAILSEEFQRMFKFMNEGAVVTDRLGGIIDANQAFLDVYGYDKDEVIGKNPRILKSVHSTKDLYARMWRDILDPNKGFWRGEIINKAKDGAEVPALLTINAVKDSEGEIRNFLGITLNMSREKELDRLNKMYIDYIVHDMRGPLTTIVTNSELLEMQITDPSLEKARKKLGVILSCALKLSSMTSDILDYSRAQSGSLILRKERINIGRTLKDAAMPFENSEKKLFVNGFLYGGNYPLRGDKADDGMEMVADPDKLQRIIFNLLSNAFKNAADTVKVNYELGKTGMTFTVSDDGKGLSEKDAAHIFEIFYQTDDGVRSGGAGLGLNIVKSFVEAHGGKIWVDPGSGNGATFGFSIPV